MVLIYRKGDDLYAENLRYSFAGIDSKKAHDIEEIAKYDPGRAVREFDLTKATWGGDFYTVISGTPDMRTMTMANVPGALRGSDEEKFLKAIPNAK